MAKLAGNKGFILSIANEHGLAFGCARSMRANGAELAVTPLNAIPEPYVRSPTNGEIESIGGPRPCAKKPQQGEYA